MSNTTIFKNNALKIACLTALFTATIFSTGCEDNNTNTDSANTPANTAQPAGEGEDAGGGMMNGKRNEEGSMMDTMQHEAGHDHEKMMNGKK